MRVSIKVDYAIRAMAHLAAVTEPGPTRAEDIAVAQDIPVNFLLRILNDLKNARLVSSQRGNAGGYFLIRSARDVSLADIIRSISGPLANVHDESLSTISYRGPAAPLTEVWMALRTSIRNVLETVSLADLVEDHLPTHVKRMAEAYRTNERYK